MAPENVALETKRHGAGRNGRWSTPSAAIRRLRRRCRSSWNFTGSAVRPPVDAGGFDLCGFLVAFVAMPVLANWPQSRPADAKSKQAALQVVKVIHTFAWAFFVSCILAIPILAWRGRFDSILVPTILVFIEIAVLIANEWRCPLTNVAAHYADDRSDNFDIYLPLWLARRNKLIFG
jgi:hypothetical protein